MNIRLFVIVLAAWAAGVPSPGVEALKAPDYTLFSKEEAERYDRVSKSRLAPAYPWLADYAVKRFRLQHRPGLGVDLGGGPGDMLLLLAARTDAMYWINADINTWFGAAQARDAVRLGLAHRTSFIFADAGALPFRDGCVSFVFSRGSYPFWGDLEQGLREVVRVLEPGGAAMIGRGLAPTMPEDRARALREKAGSGPAYDPDADAERLRDIARRLGLADVEILRHRGKDTSINFGVWLCFRKP